MNHNMTEELHPYSAFPTEEIVLPLLYWYAEHARRLPWRESPTPYHVWISEIMLQQTRVEAVRPYYLRFIEALPDPAALASADDEMLNKLWQGLGYYSRARNLKKAAQVITESCGGNLPDSYDRLHALPGIGPYTAGAIASIAFGLPEPAVDGNVMRVMTRLACDGEDILKQTAKDRVTNELRRIYPRSPDEASAMTQALMELGATVCAPNGKPHCDACPLAALCRAHAEGRETEFPKKTPKKPRTAEEKTILLLCEDGRYAVRKRPGRGLLAGLWEFPSLPGQADEAAVAAFLAAHHLSPAPGCAETLPPAVHIFTHIEWHMTGLRIPCRRLPDADEALVFASPEELSERYCIPSAFRAYEKLLVPQTPASPETED